jgi:Tfp pilus assembly protein FimT
MSSIIRKGFTMVEMTLSVAMLTLILGMSIPMYRTFAIRNDLDIATTQIVQGLHRAQTLSEVADGDTTWGLHVSVGSILIYKGASYATRDVSFDEDTQIASSISLSGLTDVLFAKVTGIPGSTGTFTLTSASQETRNVTINQKGMVDY